MQFFVLTRVSIVVKYAKVNIKDKSQSGWLIYF